VISSFGFCRRWRRQCLAAIQIPAGGRAIDLMTGMAELCPDLSRKLGAEGRILAIDISAEMCREASRKRVDCALEVVQANVLSYGFEHGSADVVVSSFGLKAFSPEQMATVARLVADCLKPEGVFSFIEISVPKPALLQWPYMFYVCFVIPVIGLLFLGNPGNYRLLGIYTKAFLNCRQAERLFRQAGLEVQYHSYFFGCATGISGRRPAQGSC
jgi:ubiquinone/menaquinone biosynthesis C-methylase UbiE